MASGARESTASPLTFGQEQLIIIEEMAPRGTLLFPLRLRVPDPVCSSAVKEALSWIVKRYDALRMSIVPGIEPGQISSQRRMVEEVPAGTDPLLFCAATSSTHAGTIPLYYSLDEADRLPQVTVYLHHIFIDGWSAWLIAKDFSLAYSAALRRERTQSRGQADSFAAYARHMRHNMGDAKVEEHMSFWAAELRYADPLKLPYLNTEWNPGARFGRFPALLFELEECTLSRLIDASIKYGASSSAAVLAAFSSVLSAISGQRDILLQAAIADRGRRGTRDLVGFLSNRCVLRVQVPETFSTARAIASARTALFKALRHQCGPFLRDGRHSDAGRVLNLSPRVTLAFNHEIQNHVGVSLGVPDRRDGFRRLGSCLVWDSKADCLSDLHLEMLGTTLESPLRFRITYRPDLWDLSSMEHLGQVFAESLLRLANGSPKLSYSPTR